MSTNDLTQIILPEGIIFEKDEEPNIFSMLGGEIPKEFQGDLRIIDPKEVKECESCGWKSWVKVEGCSKMGCDSTEFSQWTEKDKEEWLIKRQKIFERIIKEAQDGENDCDCENCTSLRKAIEEGDLENEAMKELEYRVFSCSFGFQDKYKG